MKRTKKRTMRLPPLQYPLFCFLFTCFYSSLCFSKMKDCFFLFFPVPLFLFLSLTHDLIIRHDFYSHAEIDAITIKNNIDNEIDMERGIHDDVFIVCVSGCRDDLNTYFSTIQFTLKSRKTVIFSSKPYSIRYTYNRQKNTFAIY